MTSHRAPVPPARLVLLGHPVAHSLSPAMQGAALRAAGLPGRYEALDVPPDRLADLLPRLGDEGAGGNVTIPHKEAVARAAGRLTPEARRVGAVNTFWHESGVLVGHNTDLGGARAAMVALWSPAMEVRPVLVLGAGGSAAALLVALAERRHGGVRVVARTPARAERLAERVGVNVAVVPAEAHTASVAGVRRALVEEAGLVINATPIGQRDSADPVPPSWLAPDAAALDLVYAPGGTAWVRACRSVGRRAEDGRRMLVEQGALAFTAWFGVEADRDAMWAAVGDG